MNYELIKAAIAAVIKENGNEEITGNLLQQVLHSIINILGVGYQYMGMATPSTAPGAPDARQFYFAAQEGAYSNFSTSPITELDGRELAIFYYDTAWHVVMTGVATRDAMVGYAFYGESLASGSVITGIDENTFFLVGPGTYTINGYSTTISTPGVSALMYDVSNDELIDYTLLPYDTTPTEDSKNAITSGAVKTALDSKIDKVAGPIEGRIAIFTSEGGIEDSGVEIPDLATQEDLDATNAKIAGIASEAGLAEAVIDTDGAGTEQEFTFRKSGGDGGAYYRNIKGKTIVVDDQLASNDAEAVKTTGANQWDEEWENGAIYTSNGTPYSDPTRIRSTNYIPVLPQTLYAHNGAHELLIVFFDSDYNILQYVPGAGATAPVINKGADAYVGSAIFNTPDNCAYIKFTAVNSPTYNHDICINLSNPAINGQYFPYWKRTLQLGLTTKEDTDGNVPFADGMKGAGTAADWADKVGGEKRMGRLNLGDLNWEVGAYGQMQAIIAGMKTPSATTDNPNIIASLYQPVPYADRAGYTSPIWDIEPGGTLEARNTGYSDAATFKAAMSGVMLDYELATPVPFTWAEPLNLGVKVDENGTERAVAPEGATAPSAPFVADTTYTMSVARIVAKLNSI